MEGWTERTTGRWAYGGLAGALVLWLAACSPAGAPDDVTPTPVAAPTNLEAQAGDGTVTLSWQHQGANGTLFRVYREEGTEPSEWGAPLRSDVPGTAYADEDVTNDVRYWYAVDAVTPDGRTSPRSSPVSAVPSTVDDPGPVDPGPVDPDPDPTDPPAYEPPAGTWAVATPAPTVRQEVAYVEVGGLLYLAGGSARHERFDPRTGRWENLAPLPDGFVDHIQAVAAGGKIYYIGGLTGWPSPQTGAVHIYDTATNTFTAGASMNRPRGAGGVAVHDGRIYYAGGIEGRGSSARAVPWFDVYDIASNSWSALPDMPTARDHFHAAMIDGRFYAIGGRDFDFNALTGAVEAFDVASETWQVIARPLPTPRAGFAAAVVNDREIVILGGEGLGRTFEEVEAFDTVTQQWRSLPPMPTPRHGIQAATCGGAIFIAAGGTEEGDAPTAVHEVLLLEGGSHCGFAPND